ncbi:MAG: TIGR03009 domain-containing protein [Pirellula sp.]
MMKSFWMWWSQSVLLRGVLCSAVFLYATSSVLGQQPNGSQGNGLRGAQGTVPGGQGAARGGQGTANRGSQSVAPPAAGYGQTPVGQPGNANGQPRGNAAFVQQPTPGNPNPNLNPNQVPVMNAIPPGGKIPGAGSGKETVTSDPYAANPLTPQELAYVDQVLVAWEQATSNITEYACKFKRWQYNSSDNFVEQLAAALKVDIRGINTTVAEGEVKYMAPDQGMFKIERLMSLTGQVASNGPGQAPSNRPEYKEFANQFGDWWLCDGKVVYDYDRNQKKCKKISLPPEMQGKAILDSPMPFVFGVKAEKIKERYWVRILPISDNKLVLVEVYPKFQADAINYDHVHIYLDRKEFLPANLVKFNTGHVDKQGEILKDDREIFQFMDQAKNATLLQKFSRKVLGQAFIPLDIPKDWEVVDIPYAPPAGNVRAAEIPVSQQNPLPNMPPNGLKR